MEENDWNDIVLASVFLLQIQMKLHVLHTELESKMSDNKFIRCVNEALIGHRIVFMSGLIAK